MTSDTDAAGPNHPHDPRSGHRSHTPEERAEFGRAARKKVPRSSLGGWTAGPDREDPLELLIEQGETRVQSLLPIRYGRMSVSPFTFFRGAALPMAADLATQPNSGLRVQLCGDAHILNFGMYGTPERNLVFDINDFDETAAGPFEWDLKRMVASIVLASRERGDTPGVAELAVRDALAAYHGSMVQFAGMNTLDVWYAKFDVDQVIAELGDERMTAKGRTRATKELQKVRRRDSQFAASKTTHVVDGRMRFISNPPLQVPGTELSLPQFQRYAHSLDEMLDVLFRQASTYRHSLSPERRHLFDEYRIADVALRVVGVGSVGTRCFILLLIGRDESDPLILQVKQSEKSVLERYCGNSEYSHPGERVVVGQKLTQAASDLFLGWTENYGGDGVTRYFYLRQFRDWKGSIDYVNFDVEGFRNYAKVCAWAIAKAHARSGDQIAISSYIGSGSVFADGMTQFAFDYAAQSERDHAALLQAIADGRLEAETGV